MRFRVLGALEVVDDAGVPRAVSSPSQRRVLAVLLARAGSVASDDSLLEAVWGEDLPADAVGGLRTYVSRLRPLVGERLERRGAGYRLEVAPADVDAGQFEQLLQQADADPTSALPLLDAALRLWRGNAFGEEADVPGVRTEAGRLEHLRSGAGEARAAALLATGRADEAAAAAEVLLAADPWREGCWAVLVEALTAADRPAEALRAAQRARGVLAEVGLEPSSRLRAAERAVLAGPSELASPPPPPAPPTPRASLEAKPAVPPGVASSFLGRDLDRDRVVDLLGLARVVTLVGPGGVGKTRLALEAARAAAPRYGAGAVVVDLSSVAEGAALPSAVASALGLTIDAVDLSRVGRLDLLLVLDNAERLVTEAATLVEQLTAGGDDLHVLVTSRERLGVHGEHVWLVAPLAVGSGSPAGRLFVERATAAAPDLVLSADDADVVRIVARLDGLPLAIEMAAALASTTGLGDLAATLDERLDELRSPRRGAAERHRSLAAVLAWSEAALDEDEAATLAALSVFAGPVTADDIAGTLGHDGAPDRVRALVARSLVVLDRGQTPVRYRLLQTVREFAARRLAEADRGEALARRHAVWFTRVAADADGQLRTVDERAAHDRLDAALADLRAAHHWARAHDLALAAALSAHLHLYAQSRMVDEVLSWAEALVDEVADDEPHLPVLLASAAGRAANHGELDRARRLAARGVAVAPTDAARLAPLEALGDTEMYAGNLAASRSAHGRMAELGARTGDRYYEAVGWAGVVMADAYADPAAPPDTTPLVVAGQRGPLAPTARGWLAYTCGEIAGDVSYEAALAYYDEALHLARGAGSRMLEGVALVSACSLRARLGAVGPALAAFDEAVRHWAQLADRTHQVTTLRNLVMLLQRADAPGEAVELLAAVDSAAVPTYGEEAARLTTVATWAEGRLPAAELEGRRLAGAGRDVEAAAQWALGVLGEQMTLGRRP